MTKKPQLTYVERLLEAHRKKPTKTVYDRKQITLDDYLKRQSFEKLDEAIRRQAEGGV
jgi:hypothetical protein